MLQQILSVQQRIEARLGDVEHLEKAVDMLKDDLDAEEGEREALESRVEAYRADQVASERDRARVRFTGNDMYALLRQQDEEAVRTLLLEWYDSYRASSKCPKGEGNKRGALETAHVYDMPRVRG